jgi:cardiolipin synthase
MFRVEGDAVANLQATFAENWLEASGEILAAKEFFPLCEEAHSTPSLVVNSSPSAGRSTRARILFQMLLASAQKSVLITTPYFLPDRSARAEMVRAIRERGVKIQIIVPGKGSDHALTRSSSRRLYGDLLAAGAKIYEYNPTMIHAKTLVVDGMWSVVGSTNFDNRSFGINDEVNLAAFDTGLAARIAEDFERDRAESRAVSYEDWRRRSIFERIHELFGMLLERQQ